MIIINNVSKMHPDYLELLDYCGPTFRLDWCNPADEKITAEAKNYTSTHEFVVSTLIFCYQSIALWQQGIHRVSLSEFMRRTTNQKSLRVIDVGSGGGQTGIILNHLGYDVSFSDIYSRSMFFLEWRLRRHHLQTLPIFVLEADWATIPHHDWALCFDVLEHLGIEERHEWIDKLANLADHVMVNLIRNTGSEMSGVHFPLDFGEVTRYVEERYTCEFADIYPDKDGKPLQRLLIYSNARTNSSGTNARTNSFGTKAKDEPTT